MIFCFEVRQDPTSNLTVNDNTTMSDKITEITEEMAVATVKETTPEAQKPEAPKPQTEYIGAGAVYRATKNILISGLNIDDFVKHFRERRDPSTWKPIYIVPIIIDYSAGDQDGFGKVSLRGSGVYDAFSFCTADDIDRLYPSLAAIDGWQALFVNLFEANKDMRARLDANEAYYPIMIVGANPLVQLEISNICRRDSVIQIAAALKKDSNK